MLDVIHYMFETDATSSSSGEHLQAKDQMRQIVYKEFYDRDYRYASGKSSGPVYMNDDIAKEELIVEDEPTPVNPRDRASSPFPPKKYVPPTRVNANSAKPFGSEIDSPLG